LREARQLQKPAFFNSFCAPAAASGGNSKEEGGQKLKTDDRQRQRSHSFAFVADSHHHRLPKTFCNPANVSFVQPDHHDDDEVDG
jgi:hypothetical protein